jgi:hypothetical protein
MKAPPPKHDGKSENIRKWKWADQRSAVRVVAAVLIL